MKLFSSALVLLAPAVIASAIPAFKAVAARQSLDIPRIELKPPGPTKALNIVLEREQVSNWWGPGSPVYSWRFYETTVGKKLECPKAGRERIGLNSKINTHISSPTDGQIKDLWPGPYTVPLKIGDRDYNYKNDGHNNAGTLWTLNSQGNEMGFGCHHEQDAIDNPSSDGTGGGWRQCEERGEGYRTQFHLLPVVYCEWNPSLA
jgi:hypothetical protein